MADIVDYRRADRSKIWHCCRNCADWPPDSFNIIRMEELPAGLQLCAECTDLQGSGRCAGANPPPE